MNHRSVCEAHCVDRCGGVFSDVEGPTHEGGVDEEGTEIRLRSKQRETAPYLSAERLTARQRTVRGIRWVRECTWSVFRTVESSLPWFGKERETLTDVQSQSQNVSGHP